MITRWLTYLRLFDFDVRHVPGNKNGAADALSRRSTAPADNDDDDDVDDYFDAKLYRISAAPSASSLSLTARVWLIDGEYSGDDLVIGTYLETLQRPDGMDDNQFRLFRKKALNFLVRDGYLFKRSRRPGTPPRRVVGTTEQRLEILRALHDEAGHRGRQATFEKVSRRYQWKGIYSDVSDFVKTCEKCQLRKKKRYDEPLHPTWSILVWEKVGVDVVYMPVTPDGYGFIVFARDDLSGWVEARALKRNTALEVSTFLYEDVICRHGLPRKFVMDNGPENKDITKTLLENYNVKNINISAYHPQLNGLVERRHASVINALAKYCQDRQFRQWNAVLPLALWADRVTVRRSTGYSAFHLVYGRDCLLPVDFTVVSWSLVDWEEVKDREELLMAKMRQLDERELAEARAADELEMSRRVNKDYFDQHKQLRPV
jgi:transposase InsO family protein